MWITRPTCQFPFSASQLQIAKVKSKEIFKLHKTPIIKLYFIDINVEVNPNRLTSKTSNTSYLHN